MQGVDALVYSILVLLSFEAVVFDVVYGLQVHRAPEGVGQLIFNGSPSEQKINCGKDESMEQEEPGIFVEACKDHEAGIFAMNLPDPFVLTLPGLKVLAEEGSWDEVVDGLTVVS